MPPKLDELKRQVRFHTGNPSRPVLNMFTSHPWHTGEERELFHGLLEPRWRRNLHYRDWSVSSDHPIPTDGDVAALFDALNARIYLCDVLVVFAGMYANHREFIQYEMLSARAHNIPIIAVAPRGQERIPELVSSFATKIVRWNGDSAHAAILSVVSESLRKAIERQELNDAMIASNGPAVSNAHSHTNAFASVHSRTLPMRDQNLSAIATLLTGPPLPRKQNAFNVSTLLTGSDLLQK